METQKTSPKWRKILLSILCVVLAVILLVLVFAAVYMNRMFSLIDRVEGTQETLSSSEIEELLKPSETRGEDYTGPAFSDEDIIMPTTPAEIIQGENVVNILLIGQDRRGGNKRSLSDAMILCTINKEKKTLTMTSFLRDTYVQIPGHSNNKLNIAYPVGGMELLDETLKVNFGVQVDGNVEVDFSQFSQIIDLLGGVDIELTGAEAAHLNHNYGFGLSSGKHHLNGEQALAYSRIRKLDSDFGRTNRQRTVMTAMLNQFRNASLSQLTDTLSGILGLITTDMTDAEIMGYMVELAPLLKDLTIKSQSIPVEGSYYFGDVKGRDVVDCIFIDFEVNRQALKDSILSDD